MSCFRALLPIVGSCVAFLLGILCLFAGSQRQILPQADLLTLYTGGAGGAGAPDYFSVYTMSYCTGFQETVVSDETTNSTTTTNEIIGCSDRSVLFTFNPSDAILKALGTPSGSLSPDSWPSCITDDFEALGPTNTTMVVFFIFGTATAALAIGARIWSIACARASENSRPPSYTGDPSPRFDSESPPSLVEFVIFLHPSDISILQVSLLSFGIASVIASVITTEFVKLINKSGNDYGVSATTGTSFLGMSWTAAVLQALCTTYILIEILRYHARCRMPRSESAEEKPLVGCD
ncbi:hypothetical protein BO94DRAFT_618297 [Aspergillus sclerotioniger CBS 115572]|uniref:Uncharacterized protein n=1 Tax=Aspergillus sclerotioniger CBS 115572 TaxID=1450535 RepID=A0A317X3D1_9EURO|nr:hypothetical protein BO94DRAFT_618297 [Aspergillus sclerotioniger CBS 115572]PWY91488.1 hypothetical protein BO94DRAFT_618297 [Aspergillus sclerotioniger CBS 115572]